MHTRILMSASAAFLAMLGLAALFLPQELLIYAGSSPAGFPLLVIQVSGAAFECGPDPQSRYGEPSAPEEGTFPENEMNPLSAKLKPA